MNTQQTYTIPQACKIILLSILLFCASTHNVEAVYMPGQAVVSRITSIFYPSSQKNTLNSAEVDKQPVSAQDSASATQPEERKGIFCMRTQACFPAQNKNSLINQPFSLSLYNYYTQKNTLASTATDKQEEAAQDSLYDMIQSSDYMNILSGANVSQDTKANDGDMEIEAGYESDSPSPAPSVIEAEDANSNVAQDRLSIQEGLPQEKQPLTTEDEEDAQELANSVPADDQDSDLTSLAQRALDLKNFVDQLPEVPNTEINPQAKPKNEQQIEKVSEENTSSVEADAENENDKVLAKNGFEFPQVPEQKVNPNDNSEKVKQEKKKDAMKLILSDLEQKLDEQQKTNQRLAEQVEIKREIEDRSKELEVARADQKKMQDELDGTADQKSSLSVSLAQLVTFLVTTVLGLGFYCYIGVVKIGR